MGISPISGRFGRLFAICCGEKSTLSVVVVARASPAANKSLQVESRQGHVSGRQHNTAAFQR